MARSSRRGKRGRPGFGFRLGGAPRPDNAAIPPELARFLTAQYGGAFKAAGDIAAGNRPNPVMVLPRSTQFLSEQERQRRINTYGRDKPSDMLSNEMLRVISTQSLLNVSIHAVRRNRMRAVCRQYDGTHPGWAIVHVNHFQPDFDATRIDGLEARIKALEPLFKCPHPRFDTTLSNLMVKATEDHLALDRVAINLIKGKLHGLSGFGTTGPVQMTHVDGGTIWPVDLYLDHLVRLNGLHMADGSLNLDAGLAHFYEQYGVRLEDCAYLQIDPRRGIEPIAFLAQDELLLAIANPSPQIHHWGYGRSPAEEGFFGSTLFLHGLSYVANFFRDAFADVAALLSGQYQDTDVKAITDMLRTSHAGTGKLHHSPVIQLHEKGDLEFVDVRKAGAREMQFSESMHMVAMLTCSPYSMDPSEINLDPKGPGQNSLSERDRGEEVRAKRDIGDYNLLHFFAEHVLTPIVQAHDSDLMFVWLGLDDEDEQRAIELLTKQQDYHLSIDEARRVRGEEPYREPWSKYPKWRAQQIAQSMDQEQAQQRQMQQQMAMQQMQPQDDGQGQPQEAQGPQQEAEPPQTPMPEHMGWNDGEGLKGGVLRFTVLDDGGSE